MSQILEHLEDGGLDLGPLEVWVLLFKFVDVVVAKHLEGLKFYFLNVTGFWVMDNVF